MWTEAWWRSFTTKKRLDWRSVPDSITDYIDYACMVKSPARRLGRCSPHRDGAQNQAVGAAFLQQAVARGLESGRRLGLGDDTFPALARLGLGADVGVLGRPNLRVPLGPFLLHLFLLADVAENDAEHGRAAIGRP